jgi:hemerythrin HHE cation binding domain-containing protein
MAHGVRSGRNACTDPANPLSEVADAGRLGRAASRLLVDRRMLGRDMSGTHGRRSELRRRLIEDHQRIQQLALSVAACVDADDPHGALDEWPAFEKALLDHMNTEELHVLPRFAEVDPGEAARLRDEHTTLRSELGELCICLELHTARKPMFDALIARIWRHAEREDELMYTWAERTLPERAVDVVTRRLDPR